MGLGRFWKQCAWAVVLILGWGWAAGCGSDRKLIVPTTPPSEREQNPGPDYIPPAGRALPAPARSCQSAEDCFNSAMIQKEDGDRSTAAADLRFVRIQYPGTRWAGRAGFVLGMWASEEGSPEADTLLNQAAAELPDLEEYSLFFTANGQAKGGRTGQAIDTYGRLLEHYPDTVLRRKAAFQKIEILIEAGICAAALTDLERFVVWFPDAPNVGQAFRREAECAVAVNDPERAARALQQVLYFHPDRPEAEEAGILLARLMKDGVSIPEPTIEMRRRRGKILSGVGRYEEAAGEFKKLFAAADPNQRDPVILDLGKVLVKQKKYGEAKTVLGELAGRTDHPDHWTEAVFWLGRMAIRQGEETRLVEFEAQLAGRFPKSPERAKLLYWMGDFYEGRKKPEEAHRAYQRLITELPDDPSAENAVWRIGWMAYKSGRYQDAIDIYEAFLGEHPDSVLAGQFGYWIGRSAERLGRIDKAVEAYRSVCREFMRSFYCYQAADRLAGLNQGLEKTGSPESVSASLRVGEVNAKLIEDRHYLLALELMAMRLNPEAQLELLVLTERYARDRGTILRLSELHDSAGNYYESLRLLKLYFEEVLLKGGEDVPLSFWERAYPREVVRWIKDQDKGGTVDPYLAAAVIREESAFNPEAVSKAGALGLMQIMPLTGEWVAERVGLNPFREELLLDQTTNIRLGTWYLGHLVRQFDGNPVLAVASYNAGPKAVRRWAKPGALDEFIESIPYSETRYYTKRVMRSYNEFRRVAGESPSGNLFKIEGSP